jgi:hypothetical protein
MRDGGIGCSTSAMTRSANDKRRVGVGPIRGESSLHGMGRTDREAVRGWLSCELV